ncbi:heavy metal-associated isoprenylated plant protein 41-like [Euphorbia lathyris]|uniref:heavy metal-associated isoprenylated plant protein 41-like n=1 Tax=Euphorbia lathyris TaxID=212925 RepID=UPI0033142096
MEEKWVKHYSSNHQILLVGEGDFSFSSTLAFYFGSASNIVATSLDTYDIVVGKYKKAKWNLEMLLNLGASTLHGVDATKMRLHSDFKMQKFDRIIFNFPHAGFHGKEDDIRLIERHKKLVLGFFANASGMLRGDGEIHVTHKTSFPFSLWNIEELAWRNCLGLVECADFRIQDYPGYNNKRGDSRRCPWENALISNSNYFLLEM